MGDLSNLVRVSALITLAGFGCSEGVEYPRVKTDRKAQTPAALLARTNDSNSAVTNHSIRYFRYVAEDIKLNETISKYTYSVDPGDFYDHLERLVDNVEGYLTIDNNSHIKYKLRENVKRVDEIMGRNFQTGRKLLDNLRKDHPLYQRHAELQARYNEIIIPFREESKDPLLEKLRRSN